MNRIVQYFWAASMMLVLVACINTVERGHLKEDEALTAIKVGTSNKDEVRGALGSPSSESSFGPLTWYYISEVKQSRSFFAPEVTDQHVTEIAFDANGTVTAINQYGMKDGKDIQVAQRVTPSEGQQLGFFEQILSNLGRFNKDTTSGISNSHSHAPTEPGGYPR